MASRAERLTALVQRHGETVTVNGTRTVRAIVFTATSGLLRSLLTDADLMNFSRPVWVGVLAPDESLLEGDMVSRDGASYVVRRVTTLKIGNSVVVKLALWSQ